MLTFPQITVGRGQWQIPSLQSKTQSLAGVQASAEDVPLLCWVGPHPGHNRDREERTSIIRPLVQILGN